MAFKIVFIIAAIVACVQAGGPAVYSISVPSGDHTSVGNTQEHTAKGPGGLSSQSEYSSQVQTAHSQSHVQRTSISNDAGVGIAPHVAAAGIIAGHTGLGVGLAPHGLGLGLGHGVGIAPALGLAPHGLGLAHGVGIAAPVPLVKTVAAPALLAGHGLHYG